MLKKLIGITLGLLGWSAVAVAQFPNQFGQPGYGGGNSGLAPNIYNPQTQPLSPYLNMNRGGNPAANYYFGVRPGTVGGGASGIGGAPNIAMGGNRGLFFPQLASGPDPLSGLQDADPNSGTVLPPAGHSVVFANTMGYFPSPFGANNRGNRPGLSGAGNNRPGQQQAPTPKR